MINLVQVEDNDVYVVVQADMEVHTKLEEVQAMERELLVDMELVDTEQVTEIMQIGLFYILIHLEQKSIKLIYIQIFSDIKLIEKFFLFCIRMDFVLDEFGVLGIKRYYDDYYYRDYYRGREDPQYYGRDQYYGNSYGNYRDRNWYYQPESRYPESRYYG